MKKLVATLIVLSFAGNAIAATTYTEQIVNKWTAPVAQKERQLQAQREAAQKAQKQRQEEIKKAQEKRQAEIKKAQEVKKKEMEDAKKLHQQKMEQKKKDFQNLLKY